MDLSSLRRQARLALVYLVLHRGRPLDRGQLVDALWPEGGAEAERLLSPVLSHLRRSLPDGVLPPGEPIQLCLAEDSVIDTERADAEIERAQQTLAADPEQAGRLAAAAAATLGRGFLPGLKADFISDQRSRWEERHWDALKLVVRAALATGAAESALDACRRLCEAQPVREEHYELTMRVHAAAGRHSLVAETFHEFRRRWQDEMPVAIPRPLVDLYLQLVEEPDDGGEDELPSPLRVAADRAFVGREAELERLGELWQAAGDRLSVVLVAGEPGVGKTHLVANFVHWAAGRGGRVLYGRCDEDSMLSYQPFLEALRAPAEAVLTREDAPVPAELAHLALLFPELNASAADAVAAAPAGDAGPLFRSVAALLRRLAHRRRVVLVLDDLHWADQPTLHLLRILVRELGDAPVTILGTYRPDEITRRHPFARLRVDLGRDHGYHQLDLEGLSPEEALELVEATGDGPSDSPEFAADLCQETRGNPFFMTEILRAVRDEAVDMRELAAHRLDRLHVPFEVEDVIRRRLDRLSDDAQETVADAALLGLEFDCWLLARLRTGAAPDAEDTALAALREAQDAGLVVDRGDGRFAFCHAIVRRMLDRTRGRSERARLHERAMAALLTGAPNGRYVRAAEIAHHAFEARGRLPVRTVVQHLAAAAEEAARAFAYEDAMREFERAADVLAASADREDRATQARLLIRAGRARLRAGAEAGAVLRRAIEVARELGDVDLQAAAVLALAGRYYEARAREEDVLGLLQEALDPGRTHPAPDQRVRLLARLAEVLQFLGEPEQSVMLADEATEVAGAGGDLGIRLVANQARVVSRLDVARHDERRQALTELLEGAREVGHRELAAEAYHWLIYTEMEGCRVEAARAAQAEMRRIADQLRQPLLRHLLLTWEGMFAGLDGRFAEAERHAAEAHTEGRRARTHETLSTYSVQLFNLRRDQGMLRDEIETYELVARQYSGIAAWRAVLALAHLEGGDPATGRDLYREFADTGFSNLPRNVYWSAGIGYLCEACWLLEDARGAEVLRGLLAPLAGGNRALMVSSTAWLGSADRFVGMMAAMTGRLDEAGEHFQRAAAVETSMGAAVPLVRTRLTWAACERLRGGSEARARGDELERLALLEADRLGMAVAANRGVIATA